MVAETYMFAACEDTNHICRLWVQADVFGLKYHDWAWRRWKMV